MTSVYERALGEDFERLHPRLRKRYGFDSTDRTICVGTGRMERIDSNALARPVLAVLASRDLPFPETGQDIPLTIRTYAVENRSREEIVFRRSFDVRDGSPRRFDARMSYDSGRECIVDALGRGGRLVSELHPSVTDDGGLYIGSGRQHVRTPAGTIRIPEPLRAEVSVYERYDESAERFRIWVTVTNRLLGFVFGYAGHFTIEWRDCTSVPTAVRHVGGGSIL